MMRRAYEMDLEEISLMAQVAQTAPPHVGHEMLMMISHEAMDAMGWLMAMVHGPSHDGPKYGIPFEAEEKKEDE